MRHLRPLCGLLTLALVLAHAPSFTHAQGASAGGLAAAPAAGAGATPAAGAAAGPELSAQSIASSVGGGSLGTVQTGGSLLSCTIYFKIAELPAVRPVQCGCILLTRQTVMQSGPWTLLTLLSDTRAGISATPELTQSITKPPLKAVPITVTPVAAAPAKPTPRGGLATCTFNVRGTRELLITAANAAVSITYRVWGCAAPSDAACILAYHFILHRALMWPLCIHMYFWLRSHKRELGGCGRSGHWHSHDFVHRRRRPTGHLWSRRQQHRLQCQAHRCVPPAQRTFACTCWIRMVPRAYWWAFLVVKGSSSSEWVNEWVLGGGSIGSTSL